MIYQQTLTWHVHHVVQDMHTAWEGFNVAAMYEDLTNIGEKLRLLIEKQQIKVKENGVHEQQVKEAPVAAGNAADVTANETKLHRLLRLQAEARAATSQS